MPVLTPPSEMTGAFGDPEVHGDARDLWRFYSFPKGLAIVLRDGVWSTEATVVVDDVQEYYLGGHIHDISDDKAAELIAAGFGDYITGYGGIGYGFGPYGSGPYGGTAVPGGGSTAGSNYGDGSYGSGSFGSGDGGAGGGTTGATYGADTYGVGPYGD